MKDSENTSVVNPKFSVSQQGWVVSILRKPAGKNPEHAFLIVEGMTLTRQIVLRRYDLVVDDKDIKKSQVLDNEKTVDSKTAKTVFQKDFLRNDDVYAMSWSITLEEAKILHEDVLKSKEDPPDYFISGNRAIFGMMSKSTTEPGHNCFTWARERLYNCTEGRIKMPEKYRDFIAAQTSIHLRDPESTAHSGCRIM